MSTDLSRLTASLSRSYRIERELGQGGMATVYLADVIYAENWFVGLRAKLKQ